MEVPCPHDTNSPDISPRMSGFFMPLQRKSAPQPKLEQNGTSIFANYCLSLPRQNNTMRTLLLQAPRDFVDAGIPKGYMLQVITSSTGTPRPSEVREALRRAGFSSRADRYDSAGNWIITEL